MRHSFLDCLWNGAMNKIFCGLLFSFETRAQSAENLQKIETYLNSMKSIEATFVQMASNGATAEGRLFIKKPNKIRME